MDSKSRFSSRVDNYIKYRPGYPTGVIETLRAQCNLSAASPVADIGSGTGLLARLFLELGCTVTCVEPNDEMRAAGERLLAGYPKVVSLSGSAEETGLPEASQDFVTAGQAFHWFNPPAARAEFRRVLRPLGWVALVWNQRRMASSAFLRDYEALLQIFATDYNQVNHRNVEEDPETIPAFFGGGYQMARFDNAQHFDFEGLRGRLLSSSYSPEADQPGYEEMLAELRRIFDRYQHNGHVVFEYDTRLYYGHLC